MCFLKEFECGEGIESEHFFDRTYMFFQIALFPGTGTETRAEKGGLKIQEDIGDSVPAVEQLTQDSEENNKILAATSICLSTALVFFALAMDQHL